MDKGVDTEWLRSAAAGWSLAGDQRLLSLLQDIHEKVCCECAETRGRLGALSAALRTAALALRNLDNRFVSLSSSQFVERRVYDDDDVTDTPRDVTKTGQQERSESVDELSTLLAGVQCLERHHQPISVPPDSGSGSGSGSQSETEDRLVYRPVDLYSSRPLPYRIGTTQFRDKRHAGLLPSGSDSDSSSDMETRDDDGEEYSDDAPAPLSSSSGSAHWSGSDIAAVSHDTATTAVLAAPPSPGATPAQAAAELARRLAAATASAAAAARPERTERTERTEWTERTERTERTEWTERTERTERTEWTERTERTERRAPQGVVFPCEPPPLDNQSDASETETDDIFAELHHDKQPYGIGNKEQIAVAGTGGLFEDIGDTGVSNDARQPVPPLESTPTKKPIGGISVFGKQAAESIGAAVMRRRQPQDGDRQHTHSDSDSDGPSVKRDSGARTAAQKEIEHRDVRPEAKKEKDIFDELFAKSEKARKETPAKAVKVFKVEKKEAKVEKKDTKKIDLFDDSIFDDIDDIFSSNTVKVTANDDKKKKSIFNDEDDDLFSDITKSSETKAKEKENETVKTDAKVAKASIFDSDDDIFSDMVKAPQKSVATKASSDKPSEVKPSEMAKQVDNLFNDDDDEVLFKANKTNDVNKVESKDNTNLIVTEQKSSVITNKNANSLFDNDDDDDDLFNEKSKKKSKEETSKSELKKGETVLDKNKPKIEVQTMQNQPEITTNKNISIIPVRDNNENDQIKNGDDYVNRNYETKKTIKCTISDNENDLFVNNFEKCKINPKNKTIDAIESNQISKSDDKKINALLSENDEDLFLKVNSDSKYKESISPESIKSEISKTTTDETHVTTQESMINSPYIFEDDIDDLLINSSKKPGLKDTFNNNNNTVGNDEYSINKVSEVSKEVDKKQNVESILDHNQKSTNQKTVYPEDSLNNSINDEFEDDIFEKKNNSGNEKNDMITEELINTHETKSADKLGAHSDENYIFNETNMLNNMLKETKIVNVNSELNKSNEFIGNIDEMFDDIDIKSEIPDVDTMKTNIIAVQPPKPDIFADVFNAEPPVFEKPKEPKKSKNVNALFDDDSDDEALFFKKNDPVFEENPGDFSPDTKNIIFGIFHEEPPAIEVDTDIVIETKEVTPVVQENIKTDTLNKSIDLLDNDEELFITKPANKKEQNEINLEPEMKNEYMIKTANQSVLKTKLTDIQKLIMQSEITDNSEHIVEKADSPKTETKKIGKLKPMNLNINVNTLLPGASPKKVQKFDQTDGQVISTVNNKEDIPTVNNTNTETESKLVKSVSFEGEPESPVLDNKISKERAKIQVKRRPSTRRARREAVKKSGIDFGEDSTDNSSSVDDYSKYKDSKVENSEEKSVIVVDLESGPSSLIFDANEGNIDKSKHMEYAQDNENKIIEDKIQSENKKDTPSSSESTPSKDIKSKVVYVLNDEDIFTDTTTKPKNFSVVEDPLVSQQPNNSKKSKLEIVDDDLFKTTPVTKTDSLLSCDISTECITTLGKVYKNENKPKQKKETSVLDSDDDDDDLFKNESKPKQDTIIFTEKESEKQTTKEITETKSENTKQKYIFSDDNSSKNSEIFAKNTLSKPAEAKKSLFDDLSDDESDIFGGKTASTVMTSRRNNAALFSDSDEELFTGPKSTTPTSSKTEKKHITEERKSETANTKKETKKITSIFGDDDDDEELFGGRRG